MEFSLEPETLVGLKKYWIGRAIKEHGNKI